jgi:hypothetical protein
MKIAIVQPPYLPWMGYFDMLRRVDLMIFLDTVSVNLRSFQRRNRIRIPTGWMWLTVPVLKDGGQSPIFRNARLNETTGWRRKHWKAIVSSYERAPYFDEYRGFFETFYNEPQNSLQEVNVNLIKYVAEQLGLTTPTRYASELDPEGKKTELLLDICRKTGASYYLSGPTAKNYLRPELFEARGIALEFHEYKHPTYEQRFPGFISHMSSIDLLFNTGDRAARIL